MKPAIFLDRDGTIIIDRVYLNDVAGIEYFPNAFEGLRRMRDLGYMLIVITNQSGLARGIVQIENLDAIHKKISHDLAAHGVYVAGVYHAPYSVASNHFRRKPNPGLLLEAAFDHGIDLKKSWMIGDRLTDIQAGRRAQTHTIWIDHGLGDPDQASLSAPDRVAHDLCECADLIERAAAAQR